MFKVGDKVRCVDALPGNRYMLVPRERLTLGTSIVEGGDYTITWVGEWSSPAFLPHLCVRLREVNRKTPFFAERFRLLKSTDKGMAVLNSLLLPKPKRQRAKSLEVAS